MNDRQSLYQGLSHAAWGYLFLNLDVNLGNVSILPRFVGWLLLLCAIGELKEVRRDLALLRPLGILWTLWTGADWLVSWAGGDVDGYFPPLDLVASAAAIYFHFQFLTDIAALAQAYHPEGETLSRRILCCRTAQVVLVTLFSLAPYLPGWLPDVITGGAVVILAIVYCLLGLYLMATLFALRNAFKFPVPPAP